MTPANLMSGHGCPSCTNSRLENKVLNESFKRKIICEEKKKFPWLGKQHLDDYFPSYDVAVECQGSQHFIPCKFMGTEEDFKNTQKRDALKAKLCKEHNIKLLYFSDKKYTENIITDIKELFDKIIEN